MNKMVILAAALCACPGAYAGEWYIGAGLGAARTSDAANNIAAHHTNLAQFGINDITSHDRTSTAMSLFGGYRFNKYLGAELGYSDLGVYDLRGFAGPNAMLPTGRERNRVTAFSLDALARVPLGDIFALYGKAGAALATVEERTCVSSIRFCDSSSDTNNAVHGAVGVSFSPPTLIGEIRLEYGLFKDVRDGNEFTAGDFTQWQVEYVYLFE